MDDKMIDLVDKESVKLPSGKYAMLYNGRMVILEKISIYGHGYRVLVGFSFDDFKILNELSGIIR